MYELRVDNNSIVHQKIERSKIRNTLMNDLKKGTYQIFLQPKADFKKNLIGAEALVRYIPNKKVESPAKRIKEYERLELINNLDIYVFEEVCKTLQDWKEKNYKLIPISFNLSRITLSSHQLMEKMEKIRKQYGVSLDYLEIEITETAKSKNIKKEERIMEELHVLGYKISLDDFGVDYSNLKTFIEYPFSSIKIDKSLVDKVETNAKSRILLENIIRIFHELNVVIVAEGIETQYQFDYFKSHGCDVIQGFYFSKPLSTNLFENRFFK